ncbi:MULTISPECIES: CRISPR-associated protein Cas5 [unclassified Streptomyces]|uniref:CRISPR-associated protein Cas5 n=1 Tax=unclassified Streptomyces TaxID=2593676 RepID=UPI002E807A74|nr:CRISPR-associated protein Cas5 [Streptomyces sp. NBC_00589]WTI33526.1 CRISPR-associated protein Cas5 [Streptomyces sp. NBC_00775]WTI42401.1 CRISPR-associated protein Cas5 [Streptomyces sp. NBC_00775]WUB23917.1 CRISPR-associated protein Cas5 [Streptomyces sp. NBC_00589]
MTAGTVTALQATFTAPVASFRNPLYSGVQVGLPCPPPSTVGGMLAAAAGGWQHIPHTFQFGMAFHAQGQGVDLETYHPLDAAGRPTTPVPKEREFLVFPTLTVWITDQPERWRSILRRPVWPLRLGRSQDLVGLRLDTIELAHYAGEQRGAVVEDAPGTAGTALRLPTAIRLDRTSTVWGTYRHDPTGATSAVVPGSYRTPTGQAASLLPPTHPATAEA